MHGGFLGGGAAAIRADVVGQQPSLAAPLEGSGRYLLGEVSYAVTHEGALHLEDILARRTHVSIETTDHGAAAAREVGAVMAPLLGWGAERLREEIAIFDSSVPSW